MSEMKNCVFDADGNLINIGDWDYQYVEGNGEQVAQNPLPKGATIEQKEVAKSMDGGWYVVGVTKPPTDKERIELLQNAVDFILMNF